MTAANTAAPRSAAHSAHAARGVRDLHAWASEAEAPRLASETHAAIRELSRKRRHGSLRDSRVLGGRAALDRLLTEDLPDRDLAIAKVTDLVRLNGQIMQIGNHTRRELLSLHSGAVPSVAMLESAEVADTEMIDRGVHLRVVYPTEFAAIKHVRDYCTSLSRRGAHFSFADAVPYRMIISDGVRAIVPIVADREGSGAIITTEPVLVRGLRFLAQGMLRRGRSLEVIDPVDATSGRPSDLELSVIRMMSLGLTDDAAAKRLSVSERTFRRYVAQIMDRLEATSRFQAGVRAVERGWL